MTTNQQASEISVLQSAVGHEQLSASVELDLGDTPIEVPERFVIDTADKASWVVRKIVEARQYVIRVRQWAEGELRRGEYEEAWLLRRFGQELEAWVRGELQRAGSRRKSLKLPAGTVGLRSQPARPKIVDEVQLITWCRENLSTAVRAHIEAEGEIAIQLRNWHQANPEETRYREQLLSAVIARYLKDTGELPDGMTIEHEIDVFYVK